MKNDMTATYAETASMQRLWVWFPGRHRLIKHLVWMHFKWLLSIKVSVKCVNVLIFFVETPIKKNIFPVSGGIILMKQSHLPYSWKRNRPWYQRKVVLRRTGLWERDGHSCHFLFPGEELWASRWTGHHHRQRAIPLPRDPLPAVLHRWWIHIQSYSLPDCYIGYSQPWFNI